MSEEAYEPHLLMLNACLFFILILNLTFIQNTKSLIKKFYSYLIGQLKFGSCRRKGSRLV